MLFVFMMASCESPRGAICDTGSDFAAAANNEEYSMRNQGQRAVTGNMPSLDMAVLHIMETATFALG